MTRIKSVFGIGKDLGGDDYPYGDLEAEQQESFDSWFQTAQDTAEIDFDVDRNRLASGDFAAQASDAFYNREDPVNFAKGYARGERRDMIDDDVGIKENAGDSEEFESWFQAAQDTAEMQFDISRVKTSRPHFIRAAEAAFWRKQSPTEFAAEFAAENREGMAALERDQLHGMKEGPSARSNVSQKKFYEKFYDGVNDAIMELPEDDRFLCVGEDFEEAFLKARKDGQPPRQFVQDYVREPDRYVHHEPDPFAQPDEYEDQLGENVNESPVPHTGVGRHPKKSQFGSDSDVALPLPPDKKDKLLGGPFFTGKEGNVGGAAGDAPHGKFDMDSTDIDIDYDDSYGGASYGWENNPDELDFGPDMNIPDGYDGTTDHPEDPTSSNNQDVTFKSYKDKPIDSGFTSVTGDDRGFNDRELRDRETRKTEKDQSNSEDYGDGNSYE